jgi:hypothetical protein
LLLLRSVSEGTGVYDFTVTRLSGVFVRFRAPLHSNRNGNY